TTPLCAPIAYTWPTWMRSPTICSPSCPRGSKSWKMATTAAATSISRPPPRAEPDMAFGGFDSKGSSSTMSEINMVPLIDVMLVLLVIFIITAPLLSHSIRIDVPQVSAQPVEQEPLVVDIAIDPQGVVFWNEQPVAVEDLAARFAQEAVRDPQPQVRI